MGKHRISLSSGPMKSGERAPEFNWYSCPSVLNILMVTQRSSPIPYNYWFCAWKFCKVILISVAIFFPAYFTVVSSVSLSLSFASGFRNASEFLVCLLMALFLLFHKVISVISWNCGTMESSIWLVASNSWTALLILYLTLDYNYSLSYFLNNQSSIMNKSLSMNLSSL